MEEEDDANLRGITGKRTRQAELKKINKSRKLFFQLSRFVQKDNILESQEEITTKQFISIAVLHQLNIPYIRYLLETTNKHGIVLTFIMLLLVMFLVGLPLFMLFTFLGHYSRKGCIKVWDCVPILKGIGFSVVIISLFSEFYNIAVTSMSLLLMPDLFLLKIPWLDCGFGADNKLCVPKGKKVSVNCGMEGAPQQMFSTQYYLRAIKMNQPDLTSGQFHSSILKIDLAVISIFLWFLLWVVSYQGFQRFSKYTMFITKVCGLSLVPVICIVVFGKYRNSGNDVLDDNFSQLANNEFYGTIISLSCAANDPGTIIFASAIAPSKMNTSVTSTIVFTLKMFASLWILIWFVIVLQTILVNYKIRNLKCIYTDSHDMIFALVLDVLIDLPFAKFFIAIWLLVTAFLGWVSVLYTLTAMIESILEILPQKIRRRGTVGFLICVVCCMLNLMFATPYGITADHVMHVICLRIMALFVLLLATVAITFLYSISTVVCDMHFLYAVPPTQYWVTAWTICPTFLLFAVFVKVLSTEFRYAMTGLPDNFLATMPYIWYGVMVSPLIINALWVYFRYVRSDKTTTVIKPEKTWGPRGIMKRMARLQFRPERDIRFRNPILRCKHTCLVNSPKYEKEKGKQSLKYRSFVDSLRGQ